MPATRYDCSRIHGWLDSWRPSFTWLVVVFWSCYVGVASPASVDLKLAQECTGGQLEVLWLVSDI